MEGKLYYIECMERQTDFISWWKPNRTGYTYNLNEAGKYTWDEARQIIEQARGGDQEWDCEAVDAISGRTVFAHHLPGDRRHA